jgi:predicted nucleic acid-binding protein
MNDGWRRRQYYHHPFVSEKPIGVRLVRLPLSQPLAIPPITWIEIIYGAAGKAGQAKCKTILDQFAMEYLTRADMDWAMQQLERYRLSHGVGINDCLIAEDLKLICYEYISV